MAFGKGSNKKQKNVVICCFSSSKNLIFGECFYDVKYSHCKCNNTRKFSQNIHAKPSNALSVNFDGHNILFVFLYLSIWIESKSIVWDSSVVFSD